MAGDVGRKGQSDNSMQRYEGTMSVKSRNVLNVNFRYRSVSLSIEAP